MYTFNRTAIEEQVSGLVEALERFERDYEVRASTGTLAERLEALITEVKAEHEVKYEVPETLQEKLKRLADAADDIHREAERLVSDLDDKDSEFSFDAQSLSWDCESLSDELHELI
jgi:chromatin segregation and condensation protein Rec8/ScpA/Scc1 (kleisin family)